MDYKRKILLILVIVLSMTFMMPYTAECMKKRIIPQDKSQKIFQAFDKKIRALAVNLSSKDGWSVKIDFALIDDYNRMFVAYHGECELRLPKWMDLKTGEFFKLESNGYIANDFVIKSTAQRVGDKTIYKFRGDIIVKLDKVALEMAKLCTQVATSYALDFVVGKLIDFFDNLQFSEIGEAIYKSGKNLAQIAAGKTGTEMVKKYTIYEKRYSVLKTMKISIKNGNFASFVLFNMVAVAANQGLKFAGASFGGFLGTMMAPGAGTIIGSLVGRAGSIIIGQFVMKKIGIEWYYKYQFGKLIKAAKKAKNKDIGYMTKYEDLMDQMMNKTKTEIQENSYDKFNILTNYFKKKSHNNQDLVYLADFVCEINELIRYKVLQLKDIYASRMYYQLKATIESRKFSEKEIKLFGY